MKFNTADLIHSIPLLTLLVSGMTLMLADAFKQRRLLPYITAIGFIVSMITAFPLSGGAQANYNLYFYDMIAFGGIASFVHIFICGCGLLTLFFLEDYLKRHHDDDGDAYSLITFASIGMIMFANANDLIVLFIGLEVMSVCLYILAALFPRSKRSNEAGLKYFLLGAFASGFLLYGIALLYGLSGKDAAGPTTKLSALANIIPLIKDSALFYISIGLILVGFLFKVAAFPFHYWTPDVYSGSPTPIAGFMATGAKLSAFYAFSFFLMKIAPEAQDKIITLLCVFAFLSMLYGNIVAMRQHNIKRMLAYSSIAHTGYLLLGLSAGPKGYLAVLFYMFIYSIMTIGAFGVISAVETNEDDVYLEKWKGLGLKRPWLGVAMSAFMFSLAGIPPLAGFMGKYLVFGSAVEAKLYLWTILGILTSVIGAYYYIRVLVVMYFEKADGNTLSAPVQAMPVAGALLLTVMLIFFGLFPSSIESYLDALFSAAGFMKMTATLP